MQPESRLSSEQSVLPRRLPSLLWAGRLDAARLAIPWGRSGRGEACILIVPRSSTSLPSGREGSHVRAYNTPAIYLSLISHIFLSLRCGGFVRTQKNIQLLLGFSYFSSRCSVLYMCLPRLVFTLVRSPQPALHQREHRRGERT